MRTTGPAVSDFAVQEEHKLWLDWLEYLVRLESSLAFISAQTVSAIALAYLLRGSVSSMLIPGSLSS
jgi:hypothetical protein